MQFTADRKHLLKACRLATSATSDRNIKPILKTLKLKINGSLLEIVGTNLEQGVRANVPVEGTGLDSCCVRADLFVEAINCASSDKITASLRGKSLVMEIGSGTVKLNVQGSESFPDFPDIHGEPNCKVMAGVLADIYNLVRPALAKLNPDDQRQNWAYKSIRMVVANGIIELHSYNGFVFAIVSGPAPFQSVAERKTQILTPQQFIPMVLEASKEDEEQDISLWINEDYILAQYGLTVIYSRLVAGTLPELKKLVNDIHKKQAAITVRSGQLLAAVRQASLVCPDDKPSVTFDFCEDGLSLYADSRELGESEISVCPANNDGKEIVPEGSGKVNLNHKHITAVLKSFKSDDLVRLQSGGKTPFLLQSGDHIWCGFSPMVQSGEKKNE